MVNLLLNAAHAVDATGTHRVPHDVHVARDARGGDGPRAGDTPGTHGAASRRRPRVRRWLESEHRPEEVVKIVVADSGPGVPEEDRERIFDPFFTTREPGKGTGLGLAIVLRIVENFQGIVWVQSAREGGAAFHVLFPLAPETPGAPPIPALELVEPVPTLART